MLAAVDAGQQAAQAQVAVQNVPTFIAAIVTALSLPIATVFVAYISKRGDRRTNKSDRVPDVIAVLEERIRDKDNSIQALIVDRDSWRDLAWGQINKSANETKQAIPPPP